jgi:hypothetical protein
MKRFSVFSIFLLILSGFFLSAASAQDQGSVRGQLSGVVVDPTQAIIQGASITIMGPTGNATKSTNESGEFTFSALIPGFYDVKVSKDGFKATTVQKVEVLINRTSAIRVALELGAVTQTVEVVATSVSVESTSTAVTTDIADTVYENLPLGRSITSVFYVSAGVASGLGTGAQNPAISGGTGLENAYIADGVLLNDAAFGGLGVYHTRYGGLGVGINASFVKEVQVSTAAFGPQYGHSTGGVINMVTKSGSNVFHGVVGGYFQPRGASALWANQDDFHVTNKIGRQLQLGGYEGDFELGGYIPLGALKNHLFFFGAFNPTWNASWVEPVPGSGLFLATNGLVDRKVTIWDYSGKLTWQLNSNHSIESSVFGDPAHSNSAPWQTLNIDNTTANSSQIYGSRNWAVSYNGTFGSSLALNGAFTWNWNKFTENQSADLPNITDETQIAGLSGQRGAFRAQGYGSFEYHDSNTKGLQFDGHKEFSLLGQHHTLSAGYSWQFITYPDTQGYSGPHFPIAPVNMTGQDYLSVFGANEALVTGQAAESHLVLEVLNKSKASQANCTLCPYMNIPGLGLQQVFLLQDRGVFSGFTSDNVGKYHAAYINDSWEISKYATLEAGLRWEQQRMTSSGVSQLINDQWGPRIGFSVDPKGDRKSKIYANFGRYAWVMPLDAAIRELTVEQQLNQVYFAPVSAGGTGPTNLVTLGPNGVQFDPTRVLNNATCGGAACGIAKNPVLSGISGNGGASPFAPGTKFEYNDEFVVGAEHEFRGGITASVRYIDRRIKRIIEDFGGVSIEETEAGFGQFYAIGNVNAATDVVVNPNEIVFSKGATFTPTAVPCMGATFIPAGCDPTITVPTGFPGGCYDNNGNLAPNVTNLEDTFGNVLGSACFPSVNLNPWTNSSGAILTAKNNKGVAAQFGGEAQSDGLPDGYLNPKREYQAIEIEINKSFSHNWSLISNWRIARLRGNFEGAYRNDNGQNDPGISSLYDFTPGFLNEIGFQLATGSLNADRLHIVNIYPTYIFDKGPLRGLVVTPGVKIQTGVPETTLIAQQPYNNPGEVPIFGRGDLGRAPVTGTVDVHLDYPWKISETKSLHFAIDMLNIANTKRNILINQNADLDWQVHNADFMKPGFGAAVGQSNNLLAGFVAPFSARFHVSFNF